MHGFDLVATAPGVTACNMADVPLGDGSVDAAIFCLALMGTDYGAFLQVIRQLFCRQAVVMRWPCSQPQSGIAVRTCSQKSGRLLSCGVAPAPPSIMPCAQLGNGVVCCRRRTGC